MPTSPHSNNPSKQQSKNRSGIRYNSPPESFYKMLVNTSGVALWWSGLHENDFEYISPEAEKILGYSLEEALEPGFRKKLIHPEDLVWVEEYCDLATKEAHPHQLEYRIITKQGKVRTIRDIVRLNFQKGVPVAKTGVMIDVSIHMLTIEELQASNEKFYRAFHNFPIPAIITRLKDARLLDVNKNFLLASGYERSELLDKTAFELKGWTNLLQRAEIMDMLKNKERVDKYPVVMQDAFGRPRNLLISVEVFESHGERCLLLMFYDITDQIKAEDRLQAINREMEIFMYKSSHNLKGPVASIKGLLQLIKEEQEPLGSSPYLEMMDRSIKGLETTLDELMDIARVKQGSLKIEPVDLRQMFDDIGQKLRFMKEWAGIKYSIRVEQEHPFYSDINLLYSILQNLIENSVKYKRLKNNSKISVKAVVGLRQAEISVSDNGLGILPQLQERIFEMFYRAHLDSTGTGLGLYLVRNAVQKLGGTIRLESIPEEGSTFELSLPNLFPQDNP